MSKEIRSQKPRAHSLFPLVLAVDDVGGCYAKDRGSCESIVDTVVDLGTNACNG